MDPLYFILGSAVVIVWVIVGVVLAVKAGIKSNDATWSPRKKDDRHV
jgi:hypothetical protein